MEILSIGFPYSIVAVVGGMLVGGWLTALFFGVFASFILLFLLKVEILRIDPILEFVQKGCAWMVPSVFERSKQIIRECFVATVDPACLEGGPRQRLFLWHPHGLFSVSQVFHNIGTLTNFPSELKPLRLVALSTLSHIPILNQIFRIFDLVPSSIDSMRKALSDGDSLSVVLGGVREILYTEKNRMKLNIRHKKGVFRLALEYGIDIVPVLSYGENELYEQSKSRLLRLINSWLLPLGILLPVPTLECIRRWWSQPLKTPVQSVVGPPILVEKVPEKEISEKMIEDLRARYFKALEDLYSRTKPAQYSSNLELC